MKEPKIDIAYVGAVYLRMMSFADAGDTEFGHSHTYDHLSLLTSGSVAVESNGRRSEFKSPHIIVIPKNVVHKMVALEPNTVVCCVHAMRSKDNPGEIFDLSMLPAGTPPWAFIEPIINDKPD